jgi:hypothetical protein
VNHGILSGAELGQAREGGLLVTDFKRRIGAVDSVSFAEALDTIRQHHPRERIWVEH